MRSLLHTDCREAMDDFFGDGDDEISPLYRRLAVKMHLLLCPSCSQELRQFEICRDLLKSGFFPPSPSLDQKVMEQITMETVNEISEAFPEAPGGFSFRTWVIIGFFIFISLTASFVGTDFIEAASISSSSFLVPLGITIGIMLTGYSAFFIGSHLKELSNHFKLR